jgi:hypothetical protein
MAAHYDTAVIPARPYKARDRAKVKVGVQQCVALKVQHLSVVVAGNAHVADQHVRKTSLDRFPRNMSFRQGRR